jgi:ribosome biogenesis GTPase
MRSTGSWYDVRVGPERTVSSRVRGKFRLEEDDVTNPVAVGDRVTIRLNEDDDTGLIVDIHERESKLSRRAAGHRAGQEHIIVSNVDAAWGMQAMAQPHYNLGFVDRFLVMAEINELPAGLIFNKIDLADDAALDELDTICAMYDDIGYTVLQTSATDGAGVDAFRERLTDRISVVTGPSGVGKSTLLNAVEPGLDLRTGEISEKTQKGTHTTTYAELLPLSDGGYIVDTPGIREFGILDLEPDELAFFFVEFLPHINDCKFDDCTHDHEPGCAVKAAVEEGVLYERRYESYLNILKSLRAGEARVDYQ